MAIEIPFACETPASMRFGYKMKDGGFQMEFSYDWHKIAQEKDIEYIFPLYHPNLILKMWHEEHRLGNVFDKKKIRQVCESTSHGKKLRPEKKEAIIRVAIFLSRHINKKLLGVGFSIREMALLLDMTPQRVSKAIEWLSQQNFISLQLCKRGSLVLGSYIRIEPLFWSSFTQDICKDELEEIFNGQPKGIEDYYRKQLLLVESSLRQLIKVTRDVSCDDETKEYAYHSLEGESIQRIRVKAPLRLPFIREGIKAIPPVGTVVQTLDKDKVGILVSRDEIIYFDNQLIKVSVDVFAKLQRVYSQRHLYVTCIGGVAYGLEYVAARANQLYNEAKDVNEFGKDSDFVVYCLWQRRNVSMVMRNGEQLDRMLSEQLWIEEWRAWDITRKCIGSDDE